MTQQKDRGNAGRTELSPNREGEKSQPASILVLTYYPFLGELPGLHFSGGNMVKAGTIPLQSSSALRRLQASFSLL